MGAECRAKQRTPFDLQISNPLCSLWSILLKSRLGLSGLGCLAFKFGKSLGKVGVSDGNRCL